MTVLRQIPITTSYDATDSSAILDGVAAQVAAIVSAQYELAMRLDVLRASIVSQAREGRRPFEEAQ